MGIGRIIEYGGKEELNMGEKEEFQEDCTGLETGNMGDGNWKETA